MKNYLKLLPILVIAAAMTVLSSCSFNVSTANISDAKLTKDDAGTQPSTVFGQKDTIYLKVQLANAPDSSVTSAQWIAVDVEGDVPKNHPLQNFDIEHGSGVLTFNLSNDQMWPKGKYRVDISLNGEMKESRDFSVE